MIKLSNCTSVVEHELESDTSMKVRAQTVRRSRYLGCGLRRLQQHTDGHHSAEHAAVSQLSTHLSKYYVVL